MTAISRISCGTTLFAARQEAVMPIIVSLNIPRAVAYARRWAFSRNPAFYDFDGIGGDCTNFVSQCLFAGGAPMNFTPDLGWYYRSPDDRAAAWTGVEYLWAFLTSNTGVGPFGIPIAPDAARAGDVIQLGRGGTFYHSLFVVWNRDGDPAVAAHSEDAFGRALSTYRYEDARAVRVQGARREGRQM